MLLRIIMGITFSAASSNVTNTSKLISLEKIDQIILQAVEELNLLKTKRDEQGLSPEDINDVGKWEKIIANLLDVKKIVF